MSEKSQYRSVFCQIWSDDKFPFMSDDAQLVWFHAYTCEMSNALGLFKASIEALAADKRWDVERYRKGLGECLTEGLIEYDERFHVVYFPRFFRWNRPANPNTLTSWLKCWDRIPPTPLKAVFIQQLKRYVERWGERFGVVIETFGVTDVEPSPHSDRDREYSVPIGTAAAASPPPPDGEETLPKDAVFKTGVRMLMDQDETRKAAASFLGGLVKTAGGGRQGEKVVAEVIAAAAVETPLDLKPWLTKAVDRRMNGMGGRSKMGQGQRKWSSPAGAKIA